MIEAVKAKDHGHKVKAGLLAQAREREGRTFSRLARECYAHHALTGYACAGCRWQYVCGLYGGAA